jgi:hypothetical protein
MTIHIKRFLEKMSAMDSKQNKDLVLPIAEARGLRDDIIKILLDKTTSREQPDLTAKPQEVVISGGSFK